MMKSACKFLTLLSLLLSTSAWGGEKKTQEDSLQKMIMAAVAERFEVPIRVKLEGLRFYGQVGRPQSVEIISPKAGIGLLSLQIIGQEGNKVRATVVAKVKTHVAVAKRNIEKGEGLDQTNVWLEERLIQTVQGKSNYYDFETLGTLESRVFIPRGQMITELNSHIPALIKRGQFVEAVFEKGSLKVMARLKALEDGRKGEMVRLINPQSKKRLVAEIVSAGTVRIR